MALPHFNNLEASMQEGTVYLTIYGISIHIDGEIKTLVDKPTKVFFLSNTLTIGRNLNNISEDEDNKTLEYVKKFFRNRKLDYLLGKNNNESVDITINQYDKKGFVVRKMEFYDINSPVVDESHVEFNYSDMLD